MMWFIFGLACCMYETSYGLFNELQLNHDSVQCVNPAKTPFTGGVGHENACHPSYRLRKGLIQTRLCSLDVMRQEGAKFKESSAVKIL